MPINAFAGRVTDDGAKIDLESPKSMREHVKKLAGKRVVVTVQAAKSKRSLDQNAWNWGVAIPMIAEHCGYDKDEYDDLHYELLAICYGTKQIELDGVKLIVPNKTSSHLDTKGFSEYMEWLVRYAAKKFDVVIPLPDEPAPIQTRGRYEPRS